MNGAGDEGPCHETTRAHPQPSPAPPVPQDPRDVLRALMKLLDALAGLKHCRRRNCRAADLAECGVTGPTRQVPSRKPETYRYTERGRGQHCLKWAKGPC
jgi:hypothetical protein